MKQSVRIAVALAVVAGVASTGGAWYTGQQLPAHLSRTISETNAEFKTLTPGLGVAVELELLSLETGLFSSTAHYRVKAKGELTTAGDETKAIDDELLLVDRIEHGPFPLSRLMRLQLLPVMLTNNLELQSNPLVEPWFAATKGLSPFSVQASVGYTGNINSTLKLQAFDINKDSASLKFSGLGINARIGAERQSFNLDGSMDSLVLVGEDQSQIQLHGLTLRNDSVMGASGLYLGSSESQLKQVQLLFPAQPPLLINNMRQTGLLEEGKAGVFGNFTYGIGMFNFAGKDLGSLELAGSVKNLNTLALKDLSELYKQLISNVNAADVSNPALDLSTEQKSKLEAIMATLLADKPVLALDNLAVKTANGESRVNLSLGLNKPSAFDLPPDVLAMQTLASLDARVQVSKTMIKDVVMNQAAFDPSIDPQAAQQQAEQMAEMAGMMAVGTQLAVVDGDNIVASLKYADGQVELNGRKMPLDEFMAMGMGMAGGMGGMPVDVGAADYSEAPAETPVE